MSLDFTFMNEPVHRWIVMIFIALAVLTAWNGIVREMA